MRCGKQVFIAFKMMQVPVDIVDHMISMDHSLIAAENKLLPAEKWKVLHKPFVLVLQ
jgi:hypothetical protein